VSRSRNIKPGFFKNDRLAECDTLARLLFIGLWCEADRAGRLEDRPKRIKAEILPYDECSVDDLLQQLAAKGFIQRYQADGERYIQVLAFSKHQNPHVKEPPSTIPAPGESGASPVLDLFKHGSGPADSLLLIPDSLNQEKHVASGDDDGGQKEASEPFGSRFDEFWEAYPSAGRQAKKLCKQKWRAKHLNAKADQILADLADRAKHHEKWINGYVPNASTYLTQERWTDPIVPPPPSGGNGKHPPPVRAVAGNSPAVVETPHTRFAAARDFAEAQVRLGFWSREKANEEIATARAKHFGAETA
jgi:hypothetical protein